MQIPAMLKERIKGQPVAISDNVTAISGDLSMIGDKTLVFTDLPGLYLHDSGGMLGVEKVCKQVKLEAPGVRLKFTDQSRALSGAIAFPGGITVEVEFRQSVAKIADMLAAQRASTQTEHQFVTPLPVSIRSGLSKDETTSESDVSQDEFHADVMVTGSRLRLLKPGKTLLDLPIDRVRPALVSMRKIELRGEMIVNDASVSALTVMLPSAALATELFRVLNGAQHAAPDLLAVRGIVAPVQAKGRTSSGQLIDGHVDAILTDDALEFRAMDTGATLCRFVFAESDVHVAGTAKQFILSSCMSGPIAVSGGANLFRERLAQSAAVGAAAQRTLAQGAHPVFQSGNPVVCRVDDEGIAIQGESLWRRKLPSLSELRREEIEGQEVLFVGAATDSQQEALRFEGERNVLQSLYSAIASRCCRRQFIDRPRELIGAIVAMERDYFIYSLFGPLYEVHAMLEKQGDRNAVPQSIPLPSAIEKKLALAKLMATSVEPLRNHLDKVCYFFPSLLVKGDEALCSQQAPPRWLKDHERSYRSVLMGVQPVLAEIRMLRELLQRVRGVGDRLARDTDYGGAALSAALGAAINPLFLLSAAQQAFAASSSSDAQKELHTESADQSIERAVHQWNYLVLELLPGLWHHLLEALFPIRLQFYSEIRKQWESDPDLADDLMTRLAGRLATLITFLQYPASPAGKPRAEIAASARLLQSQLAYPGLQQI